MCVCVCECETEYVSVCAPSPHSSWLLQLSFHRLTSSAISASRYSYTVHVVPPHRANRMHVEQHTQPSEVRAPGREE